ncbi:MAG TPA: DEAD/DEAH box helicase [Trueperaceae bacterium]|nr:DEAD/DEAH box helicase [Trueperaceae bacterium]
MNSGFASFELDSAVLAGVQDAGYTKPTPIQSQTVPAALAGRDVLGLAQTGTGKTAAFVLPILQRLGRRQGGGKRKVRALVVAPTRELAEQINDEFAKLGRHTGLRSATVYGGVGFQPQVVALRGGADVIVACPGRLLDHVERGNADLRNVEVLVLDEADHMFDMGFLPSVRRIVGLVPHGSQRLLFSATMPAEVRHLADGLLTDPVRVEISRSAPADTIDHYLVPAAEESKTELLMHLLDRPDARSVLVFTRTKHRAKRLAANLKKAGFAAAELQGNLSQTRRQASLDGFRDGTFDVLVATDIAARGIDVAAVSHVINYDFPDTAEAYTHRIGRTGRAERTGEALTFVTPADFGNVLDLERVLGRRVERRQVEGFVPGHAAALEDLRPGHARAASGSHRSRGRGGSPSAQRPANGAPNRQGAGATSASRDGSGPRRDHRGGQRPGGGARPFAPRTEGTRPDGDGRAADGRRPDGAPHHAGSDGADAGARAAGPRRRRRRSRGRRSAAVAE